MLATDSQIKYLCYLAKEAEKLKAYTGVNTPFIDWRQERKKGVTVEDASLRIKAYKNLIGFTKAKRMLLGI